MSIPTAIISPNGETVTQLVRAIEADLVHIQGIETITGVKTFTMAVTAPSFHGTLIGSIGAGTTLLGNLNLAGFSLLNIGNSGLEQTANKGLRNGYAPLNDSAIIDALYLGTGSLGGGDKFLADDGVFKSVGSPVITFPNETANTIFSGPTTGSAAQPAFRALVAADIPSLAESKITNLVSDLASKVPNTRTITEGAGLAGNTYDLSANRTLAMGTPTTLTVSTANGASGTTHAHAITSSSAPGAAASLLASDASGFLTLVKLTLTSQLFINASTANLFMRDTSTGWKVAASTIITPQSGNVIRNTTFTSGTIGWNIDDAGNAEFNNVNVRGELRASVFKVNEISATAGTFGVFYSASTLNSECSVASTIGGSFTFDAKNSDVTATAMLFGVGDIVRVKAYVNAHGIIIADLWATITARTNHTTYTTYTATLNSGSTDATIPAGTAIVDYGPSGTGFITQSVDGTIGASPNLTMATHSGSPWNGFTTLLRIGNLAGTYDYTTFSTTIASGSNGQQLPQGTINVASAASFGSSGTLFINGQAIKYTGKTGTTFTGCTGGTTTLATGQTVTTSPDTYGIGMGNFENEWITIDSVNGLRLYAAGGGVRIGSGGISLQGEGALQWTHDNSGNISTTVSELSEGRFDFITTDPDATGGAINRLLLDNSDGDEARFIFFAYGPANAHPSKAGANFFSSSGGLTFDGLVIGSSAHPSHMLDVYGTIWTQNNLAIGATSFGTSAAKVLGILTGTAPSTSPADMIQIYSVDLSAGNATLGLRTETSVVTESVVSDRTLSVKINGTTYKICLKV